ncbi:S28 family serine protease [Demetria terragena]|uniref:S28 family serine protease n=1 Tax=Demetria terragena TaxID=63959 RepID=UPI0003AA5B51|nr:S28 family serine protease [Demetria terragena]
MRRSIASLVTLGVITVLPGGVALVGQSSAGAASPAQSAQLDLLDRVRALPGVIDATETTPAGSEGPRRFEIKFEQWVDHQDHGKGTFVQRLGLMHTDFGRPMVMHTSGYGLPGFARTEPTQIVDGNQINMEYRFFDPSRPDNPDWSKQLTIKQAATDQHRIIESFKNLYSANWLTTGASKGGMTATYHRRFFPKDVNGTVAYVAPNDVNDDKDVYNKFLDNVGDNPTCRRELIGIQRRLLGKDRPAFLELLTASDKAAGRTYTTVGSQEKAYEAAVADMPFGFWQQKPASFCDSIPAPSASNEVVFSWGALVTKPWAYSDQELEYYAPYYYQAAYQLGSPEPYETHIGDLLKFPGANVARTFVPDALKPAKFDTKAMPDIDKWVRKSSSQMLFIDGENDPWSAEPFNCGKNAAARDCNRYVAPGANHGANIKALQEKQKNTANYKILQWAGLTESDPAVKQIRKAGKPKDLGKIDREPQRQGLGLR